MIHLVSSYTAVVWVVESGVSGPGVGAAQAQHQGVLARDLDCHLPGLRPGFPGGAPWARKCNLSGCFCYIGCISTHSFTEGLVGVQKRASLFPPW